MKLSISIVTYQQADYVRQAIESVLQQSTRQPFEVVVGDDASTDGTQEILRELRDRWPSRLRLILAPRNHGDHGLSNFMATIDACRGEYIALLDGDDYWTDDSKLQQQIDFLDEHPQCALCAHRVRHVHDDGYETLSPLPAYRRAVADVGDLMIENFAPKISTMIRSRHVDDVPAWYRTTRVASADWVFNVLMGRHGSVGYIDRVMAIHRRRNTSLTTLYGTNRLLNDKLDSLGMLRPYFPDHDEAFRKSEQHLRRKLKIARLGTRAYRTAQWLYARRWLR